MINRELNKCCNHHIDHGFVTMRIQGTTKHYNVQFWIVDSPDPSKTPKNPANQDRELESRHSFNCRNLVNMVQQVTDAKLVQIHLKPRSKEDDFFDHIKDLLKDLTEDDLVVVYFHGAAGEDEEEYTWSVFIHVQPVTSTAARDRC